MNLSEVLNLNSLLLSFVLIKNSKVLPVPFILFSFKPLTKLAPSNVPSDTPTLNEPVCVSLTIISIFFKPSSTSEVLTSALLINFN